MFQGKLNLIPLVIILVLALILGYMLLAQSTPAPNNSEGLGDTQTSQTTTPTPVLPTTCTDNEVEGEPVITSLSTYTGSAGTKVEIRGCNFTGFEGDKNVWIEDGAGVKGILYGEAGSTAKSILITLRTPICQKDTSYSGLNCDAWLNLNPGPYQIYTTPWGKVSNKVNFSIK